MASLLFGVALIAGLVATPLVAHAAVLLKMVDTPSGGRRVHTRPIPRLGGVAVFASVLVSLLVVSALREWLPVFTLSEVRFFGAALAGAAILFVVGLLDDLRELRPAWKLTAQVLAAVVVCWSGFQIDTLVLVPDRPLDLGAGLGFALTVLWIVGVTNAFNLIDGLDGLATGIALVALATTVIAGVALGNLAAVLAAVALSGALLAFLRYNFSPARIFLGDSGSMFVGFMLAVLTVHGARTPDGGLLVAVPIFALALPILDTLLAIARRWLRGVPLSGADARHIHHRFIALGFTHGRVATVMYAIAAGLAFLGLVLAFAPPMTTFALGAIGSLALGFLLVLAVRRLDYHEFAVAAASLRAGFAGGRELIRSQIRAHDLGPVVGEALSMLELQGILSESARQFGFLHMELCVESSSSTPVLHRLNGQGARAWKIDFPVQARASAEDEPLVLRIWCPRLAREGTLHADRVAHLLALPIEEALARFDIGDLLGETQVLAEATARREGRAEARVAGSPSPAIANLLEEPQPQPSLLRRVAGAR